MATQHNCHEQNISTVRCREMKYRRNPLERLVAIQSNASERSAKKLREEIKLA